MWHSGKKRYPWYAMYVQYLMTDSAMYIVCLCYGHEQFVFGLIKLINCIQYYMQKASIKFINLREQFVNC